MSERQTDDEFLKGLQAIPDQPPLAPDDRAASELPAFTIVDEPGSHHRTLNLRLKVKMPGEPHHPWTIEPEVSLVETVLPVVKQALANLGATVVRENCFSTCADHPGRAGQLGVGPGLGPR